MKQRGTKAWRMALVATGIAMASSIGLSGITVVSAAAPALVNATTPAGGATTTSTRLELFSPWTGAPFGTNAPTVSLTAGVVSFQGAMAAPASNTQNEVFKLPAAYRPATQVILPLDLCDSTNGDLDVASDGRVFVTGYFGSDADCFTSLDGVSFVLSTAVTPLTLINGWVTDNGLSAADPAAVIKNGVVHLKGMIDGPNSTSAEPFVLPANMTPSVPVYVLVAMGAASPSPAGRLEIGTDGSVFLQEQDQGTAIEDQLTSLEGASFVLHPKKSSALPLQNGWTGQASGTGAAAAEIIDGIVRFQGGISSGASAGITKLTVSLRPTKNVYIKVDLCDAAQEGRLEITSNGTILVQEQDGGLTSAQCFTSLDGASFVK
jgi:hypothetical protein